MTNRPLPTDPKFIFLVLAIIIGVGLACARTGGPADSPWRVSGFDTPPPGNEPVIESGLPKTRLPGEPIYTPTPDRPHILPTARKEPEKYTVRANDTLALIAGRYNISLEDLIEANEIANPDVLEIGQVLSIPIPSPGAPGPDFKIIPDSELVYGPASVDFKIGDFIKSQGGYLSRFKEEVDGETLTGAQIVRRVATNYSVNPRLLLAVLEYQSSWVTQAEPSEASMDYPMGVYVEWRKGLYYQLTWAANYLNRGYYLWRVDGVGAWVLSGQMIPIAPTINAGTAGIQCMFSYLYYDRDAWEKAVSEKGLFATYSSLFGYPFDLAVEPLVPESIRQPSLQLPFEKGKVWSLTGGPHGGWDSGSAWAAIDFAPPGESLGCVTSDEWVVAATDGVIVRADQGAVVQDLDLPGSATSDGHEQTGWTILYMHIESRDRVQPGAYLHAGERIGHPSCEGGSSTGTHLHLARRYNGEWIPADQTLPFVLDGWVSRGTGSEYDGYLERNGLQVEAWGAGHSSVNAIQR